MKIRNILTTGALITALLTGGCGRKAVEKQVVMNPEMYETVEVSNPKQVLPRNLFLPVDDTPEIGKTIKYEEDKYPRFVAIEGGNYSIRGVGYDLNQDGHFEVMYNHNPEHHSMGELEERLEEVKLRASQ